MFNMTKKGKMRVFFAWQSDLPNSTNRSAIKVVLDKISKEMEVGGIKLYIDEATRDLPGSPDIPKSIRDKIEVADIFIADVSIINNLEILKKKDIKYRKVPNPNVTFELGFAVSELGWDRIILLFNKNFGELHDLPFDFDRHRLMPYFLSNKTTTQNKKDLLTSLHVGISGIIKANPLRPAQQKGLNPAQLRRERDIRNLKWLLETIHIPTLDEFIEWIPNKFSYMLFFFHDEFNGIVNSNIFHINDSKLSDVICRLHNSWNKTLSHEHLYKYDKKTKVFYFHPPPGRAPTKAEDKSLKQIESARKEMAKSLKELQEIVRKDYVEIDPAEASQAAIKSYRLFHEN